MNPNWDYATIQRIHRRLRQQLKPIEGIVSIAFGQARKDGALDPRRPFAVCIYVQRKRTRLTTAQRLPKSFALRWKAGSSYRSLELASDVVACREAHWTVRRARSEGDRPQISLVAPIVRWDQQIQSRTSTRYAFVTVAHPFRNLRIDSLVQITDPQDRWKYFATMIARAPVSSGRDVALLEITPSTLQAIGPRTPHRGIVAWDTLFQRLGHHGKLLRPDGTFPFQWTIFHPQFESIEGLGALKDLFEGTAERSEVFGPGTSGAAWMDQSNLACLQTAGLPFTTFRSGLGQALSPLLEWSQHWLSRQPGFIPSSFALEALV